MDIYLRVELLSHMVNYFKFFEELSFPKVEISKFLKFPKFFQNFQNFTSPPAAYGDSNFSTSSPTLAVVHLFSFFGGHPSGSEVVSHCSLICTYLMTNMLSIFYVIMATCIFSLEKYLYRSFTHILIVLLKNYLVVVFFILSLYISIHMYNLYTVYIQVPYQINDL